MDFHMPVMDGFEATQEIRDLGGWCASVPIIAVTANEMAKDRATCVTVGFKMIWCPNRLIRDNARKLSFAIRRN